jgi:hypothetical protein
LEPKDVYICYNSADLVWVKTVAEQIESETIDGSRSARYLRAFFDKWDIDAGQSLIDRMNVGMDGSRHVVAVLSPEFLKADWPRFEWKNIVADDPSNKKGRFIPLFLRDVSLDGTERINFCAPFRDLKYIDFRRPSEFKRSFAELIRRLRDLPPERGRRLPPLVQTAAVLPVASPPQDSWLPDQIPDLLLSNLLPVLSLPTRIWGAKTSFREKSEVWEQVPNADPFILREQRLYTFADLSQDDHSLRAVVNIYSIQPESRHEWFMDDDQRLWLMALLNSNLTRHLRPLNIRQDGKGRYYFRPGENGQDFKWRVKGGRERTVTAKKSNPTTSTSFWVHLTARMKFKRVGEKLFLSIEPAFLFTTDGQASVKGKGAGKLSLLWGGRQQNVDILRNFLFWSGVLAKGKSEIRIETGGEPILSSGKISGQAGVGGRIHR